MARKAHILRIATFIIICGGMMFAGNVTEAQQNEKVFGHEIPAFREVFIKMFRLHLTELPLEQLQTVSAQLTPTERAAMSYFLGKDGHQAVKAGMDKEKQDYLDKHFAVHTEVPPSDRDFRKLYPHILAVTNNSMTPEQMAKIMDQLAPEDIASQSFYMGEEGRATFFSEMTEKHSEVLLDRTADWVMLETGKRKYDKIESYTSIVYKTERLDGELQGTEKILLRYRDNPLGIYMKWLEYETSPWVGRQALYSEKHLEKGEVRVREKGILGVIAVTLPLDSSLAMRGSNHMVTEIGLKNLMDMIETNYRKAVKKDDIKRINHGIVDLDGHKCYKMESILSDDKSDGYYCYRMVHYIDFARSLEIRADIYRWDNKLYEKYYYTQIRINPGLTDRDFDAENPDYDL